MTSDFFLNHLWQTTAFGAVMALCAYLLRRQQARVRFGLYLAASVKFLAPFRLLVAVGQWLPWPGAGRASAATPLAAAAPVVQAMSDPFGTRTVTVWDAGDASRGHHAWMAAVATVWAVGAVVLLGRWICRWAGLARMARAGERRERGGLRVAVCEGALEPGVFGILRPVLLLPAGLDERLSAEQLEAVLAHERCHIRRRDNLWAAVHTLVECLFWFYPGVWWLGRRLVEERERACDEAVLAAGSDREAYASGIIEVCRYYAEMPAACGAGVSGGGLRQRVGEILRGQWGDQLSSRQKAALWGLGAAVVAFPLAAGVLLAQTAGPKAFDAASVRIARVPSEMIAIRFQADPQRLTIENMSLAEVLIRAYRLQPYQIKAPTWMGSDHVDLNAETATPVSLDRMEDLLRPFLAQQFGIRLHWTTTTASIYRLTVAPGGMKIKTSKPGTPSHVGMGLLGADVRLTGSMTMAQLASLLSEQMGRPVVDSTGLRGNYDLDFTFDDGGRMLSGKGGPMVFPAGLGRFMISGPGPGGAGPGPGDARRGAAAMPTPVQFGVPELSAALPLELGLKLVGTKAPVKVLVIDHANQAPAGN